MTEPLTKARDLTHVRFAAPDLKEMARFLTAFGFANPAQTEERLEAFGTAQTYPIHLTEHADEAGFRGFGLLVEDAALETLAAHDAAEIQTRTGSNAGRFVALTDPDGFYVEAFAPAETAAKPMPRGPGWNEADQADRLNQRLQIEPGPSHVKRLGHVVLNVRDFETSAQWYQSRFGLIRSDEIHMGDPDTVIGCFFRCDLGAVPSDHHTLFLLQGGEGKFEHAAFEVAGFNDLMAGHEHLKREGATHEWGVGRHILGSHIFDYWRDPWGHELEHWTDGDRLDADAPAGRHGIETLLGTQWGEVHKMLRASQPQA